MPSTAAAIPIDSEGVVVDAVVQNRIVIQQGPRVVLCEDGDLVRERIIVTNQGAWRLRPSRAITTSHQADARTWLVRLLCDSCAQSPAWVSQGASSGDP